MSERETAISIKDLHKRFGAFEVLKGISLEAKKDVITPIIGGSGSKEQSTLRCVNVRGMRKISSAGQLRKVKNFRLV